MAGPRAIRDSFGQGQSHKISVGLPTKTEPGYRDMALEALLTTGLDKSSREYRRGIRMDHCNHVGKQGQIHAS